MMKKLLIDLDNWLKAFINNTKRGADTMTYELMKKEINKYNAGKSKKTKKQLQQMLDLFLYAESITPEQYKELTDALNKTDEA